MIFMGSETFFFLILFTCALALFTFFISILFVTYRILPSKLAWKILPVNSLQLLPIVLSSGEPQLCSNIIIQHFVGSTRLERLVRHAR